MLRPRSLRLLCAVLLLCLGLLAGGCSSSGRATVREDRLPAEARHTLELIDRGGPFPYEKDGSVFGNFERELPQQRRGYYREYTVPTPGERDRGARRLVTGSGGETYYTDDHYESFEEVLR
ncbi:ribonuclease domain-containing protein [Streptomyces sp. NPDC050264]|uniref:ribonuclease domain-containing protein n=1 Tax=Streptomyces sp. NPDC050264 TaxID=3155038 RepID=UPI003439F7DD